MSHRFACFLFLLIPAGAFGQSSTVEVEKHRNIPYNSEPGADPVRHKLDLFVPKGAKDGPMMVFVHGGSWRSGNKDLYGALGETFAKQGVSTAIINYRLSSTKGEIKHPDHIKDVAKAFSWVKSNAKKYGGSPEKIYVSGHSAGGHLVALLATDPQYLKAEKCATTDVRGVMALSGVYQIVPALDMIRDAFGSDLKACEAASPISHVKGNHPPFLIAYGDKDFPFLDGMAEDLGKKLKAARCEAKVMKLPQRDHFSIIINTATKADDPLTKAMVEFMGKK